MKVNGHIIDMMTNIAVDGKDDQWNLLDPIIMENPNQSE